MVTLPLIGCSNTKVKLADKKYLKAVFERHNKVYFYDEKDAEISEIGADKDLKELLAVSPDSKRIAYQLKKANGETDEPEIVVQNLNNEETKVIQLNNDDLKVITEIEWINEDRILVTSHINPSELAYGVYDVNKNEKINSAKGILLNIYDEGDTLLYTKTIRDISSSKTELYINDKVIYEINNGDEQIQEAIISEDFSKIAFKTFQFDMTTAEVTDKVYNSDLSESFKISNTETVIVPSIIVGAIEFNDNNLYLANKDVVYKIEEDLFTETDLKNRKITKTDKPSEDQLIKFKQTLAKKFPKEFIADYLELEELQIYNIKFF